MRSYTIHFPLYNDVDSLEIGLKRGSHVSHGAPYRPVPPVVFYGSSITQGGCASKPGNAYSNLISAALNVDHINLGFSGSALGEEPMAKYIASLPMSVFVLDYDYNAPSADYLNNTHEPFFRTIREQRPDLPILMISRCSFFEGEDARLRREVIYRTYRNAVEKGDKNVYFLDGARFFDNGNDLVYTVEGCHPNDAGFLRMAEVIGIELEKILADLS